MLTNIVFAEVHEKKKKTVNIRKDADRTGFAENEQVGKNQRSQNIQILCAVYGKSTKAIYKTNHRKSRYRYAGSTSKEVAKRYYLPIYIYCKLPL